MAVLKQFGGGLRKVDVGNFERSPQWNGRRFENLVETEMQINLRTVPKLLVKTFARDKARYPSSPIPVTYDNSSAAHFGPDETLVTWFGHSVILLRINGKHLLIDPMFGEDTTPISPAKTKRFSENTLDLIHQLPKIDIVLLSHDHYDHLDMASIELLKPRVDMWFVALGVSRHLEKWGIPLKQISEFDWWESTGFEGIDITFTPSRHFSGRGLTDRWKSLWGGWTFITEKSRIYFSGDGGYGPHFKQVGDALGPFDFAFMECGQYNEHWHAIHMYPEESVQAGIDAQARVIMPVHWGAFSLAFHPWEEPVDRFTAESENLGCTCVTPPIGETIAVGKPDSSNWWTNYVVKDNNA